MDSFGLCVQIGKTSHIGQEAVKLRLQALAELGFFMDLVSQRIGPLDVVVGRSRSEINHQKKFNFAQSVKNPHTISRALLIAEGTL